MSDYNSSNDITFTIGFTQTTAESFFARLQKAGVKKIIDVRLNNTSQLSAFAKASDLSFFLKKIADIEYTHEPILAPTSDLLNAYKKNKGDWKVYADGFLNLMQLRKIEKKFDKKFFYRACLLCSESTPHFCHRRLICDYLSREWGDFVHIKHL